MSTFAIINKLDENFNEVQHLSSEFKTAELANDFLNDSDNEPAIDCIGFSKWIDENLIEVYVYGLGSFDDFESAQKAYDDFKIENEDEQI